MDQLIDIENLGSPGERIESVEAVVGRVRASKEPPMQSETASFVPGMQSIYIETWGCSHNSSDSEYMAGLLSKYGFTVFLQGSCKKNTDSISDIVNHKAPQKLSDSDNKIKADLWLLNSCTVKNPAEDHFRNMIAEARKYDKKLVVAGCVPQGQPKAPYLKGVSVIGVHQIDRVVEVVEETLKGNSVQMYGKKRVDGRRLGGASLSLPKIRKNPYIEILPVNSGCLNACTYCKTKHARGELGSYPIEEIIDRVNQAFEEGCVEIWLTSEDLGAYGIDLGTSLPDLLEKMVHHIPKGCMLRLGMTNPPYILEHLHRIAAVLKHPRVYSFIHVPVQSGSNNVLGEMKREYTREDFCNVVDTLYSEIGRENITIATDIICGFPTETEEDFDDTFSLVDKYRFSVLFNNQFYPRPGTPAAKMERQASSFEVKKRTKRIHGLFQSYEPYNGRIGDEMNILITEDSTDGLFFVGHTKAYEQVLVEKIESYMGKVVHVRVTETTKHSMKADVIRDCVVDICEHDDYMQPKSVIGSNKCENFTLSAAAISRILGILFLSFVILKVYSLCASIY